MIYDGAPLIETLNQMAREELDQAEYNQLGHSTRVRKKPTSILKAYASFKLPIFAPPKPHIYEKPAVFVVVDTQSAIINTIDKINRRECPR
jgi:acyl-ACP thioesterase